MVGAGVGGGGGSTPAALTHILCDPRRPRRPCDCKHPLHMHTGARLRLSTPARPHRRHARTPQARGRAPALEHDGALRPSRRTLVHNGDALQALRGQVGTGGGVSGMRWVL